jgi:hypothetical protein
MQRWSYLTLAIVNGKLHTRNGEEMTPPWSQTKPDDYLAQLGAEGWELVGLTQVTTKKANTTWLYFKQPWEPAK